MNKELITTDTVIEGCPFTYINVCNKLTLSKSELYKLKDILLFTIDRIHANETRRVEITIPNDIDFKDIDEAISNALTVTNEADNGVVIIIEKDYRVDTVIIINAYSLVLDDNSTDIIPYYTNVHLYHNDLLNGLAIAKRASGILEHIDVSVLFNLTEGKHLDIIGSAFILFDDETGGDYISNDDIYKATKVTDNRHADNVDNVVLDSYDRNMIIDNVNVDENEDTLFGISYSVVKHGGISTSETTVVDVGGQNYYIEFDVCDFSSKLLYRYMQVMHIKSINELDIIRTKECFDLPVIKDWYIGADDLGFYITKEAIVDNIELFKLDGNKVIASAIKGK